MNPLRPILFALTVLAAIPGCSNSGSSGGNVGDSSIAIETREEIAWGFVRATEDFAKAFSNLTDDEESVAEAVSIFSEIGDRFDNITTGLDSSGGELDEMTEMKMEERLVEIQKSFNASGAKEFSQASGLVIKPAIESVFAKMERALEALAQPS